MGSLYGAPPPGLRSGRGASENERLRTLESCLSSMCREVDDFCSAVALLKEVQSLRKPDQRSANIVRRWAFIAARDATIRVSEFEDALRGALGALGQLAKDEIVDVDPSPIQLLQRYFPDRKRARNSAAHRVRKTKNPKQVNAHTFTGTFETSSFVFENSSGILGEGLFEDVYTTTWEGRMVTCPVTWASAHRLEDIKVAFFKMIPQSILMPRVD
ncbi:hypothetical protein GC169_11275 [bacterium]|nr:hypothetical protein [bacterium]